MATGDQVRLSGSVGQTNTPQTRLPDTSGPRDGQAQNRLLSSLFLGQESEQAFGQESDMPQEDQRAPTGTRLFDSYDPLNLEPGNSECQYNELDFGSHTYLGHPSPKWGMLENNNSEISPISYGIWPEEYHFNGDDIDHVMDATSFDFMDDSVTRIEDISPARNSTNFGSMCSYPMRQDATNQVLNPISSGNSDYWGNHWSLDGHESLSRTTIAPSDTYLRDPDATWDGSDMDMPDLISHSLSDSTKLLQETREQLDNTNASLSHQDSIKALPKTHNRSNRNPKSENHDIEYSSIDGGNYGIKTFDPSKGSFGKYGSRPRCIRCSIMKTKCSGSASICTPCNSGSKRCCIMLDDINRPFTSPNLNADVAAILLSSVYKSVTVSPRWRARIFMRTGPTQHNHFLDCKVIVHEMRQGDQLHAQLLDSRISEDMKSSALEDGFEPDRVISCSIPEGYLPSEVIRQQWMLNSLSCNPSGAVGAFHDLLFACATQYTEENLSLHKLVALAQKFTAIYNVSYGKLSMILARKSKYTFRVCPRLRAQIFDGLYLETGKELLTMLKEAVSNYRVTPQEKRLPIYLTVWFLILITQHCHAQTNEVDSILSQCRNGNSNFTPDLAARRELITALINTIEPLHDVLFKRDNGLVCPILEATSHVENVNSSELKALLLSLRHSMLEKRAYIKGEKGKLKLHTGELILLGDDTKAKNLRDLGIRMIAHGKSEKTLPSNFGMRSHDTESSDYRVVS